MKRILMNIGRTLSRVEMKLVMAGGSGSGSCGQCCYVQYPDICSSCVDYCSGSDCDCTDGQHGPTFGKSCTCTC